MCGKVLYADEGEICAECLRQLPRTEHANHRGNVTELLFCDDNKLLRAGSFCFYPTNHPIRHLLSSLKFDSNPAIGMTLGECLAREWGKSGFFDGIDYIIPLPLHPNRLHRRGYNQALHVAKGISQQTGIPVDTQHLIRTLDVSKQSLKSMEERSELEEVFRVENGRELCGKNVLLVDDVITSGTTMRRAMQALHPIQRCRYAVLSIAIAAGRRDASSFPAATSQPYNPPE